MNKKIKKKVKKRDKNPFVDEYLIKKVKEVKASGSKKRIKTMSRRSVIYPDFVGLTFDVYDGHTFVPVFIKDSMIGHKLGEFALTRTFRKHPGNNAEDKAKISASDNNKKKV